MKVGEHYGRHSCDAATGGGRLVVESIVSPAVVTVVCEACGDVFGAAAERPVPAPNRYERDDAPF